MNCKSIFSVIFLLLGAAFLWSQETYNTLVYEGNREFDKKNYENATSKFAEAARLKEKDFAAHYNLGNSLYRRKLYDEAKAEFQKAEQHATTLHDKAAALYNLGNTLMEQNNSKAAAEKYKQALKQDPYNETIRKNYEIAMLQEKEKQQEQQKGGGGGQGNRQNQQSQGKDKGDTPENQSGSGQKNEGEGDGEQQNDNKNNNSGKLPKDLENSLLNRIENKERETATRILNKNSYSMPQSNEKDW